MFHRASSQRPSLGGAPVLPPRQVAKHGVTDETERGDTRAAGTRARTGSRGDGGGEQRVDRLDVRMRMGVSSRSSLTAHELVIGVGSRDAQLVRERRGARGVAELLLVV